MALQERRYPAYKDSGVPWLGEIPAHWEVVRLKWVAERNDGGVWGDPPTEDNGHIVLRSTELGLDGSWHLTEPAIRSLSASELAAGRLAAGDLVVTKSSGSAEHLGKAGLATDEMERLGMCFSNFMQRIRLGRLAWPRFYYWVLNSPVSRSQFNYLGTTTTGLANLSAWLLNSLTLPLPPLPEQRAIAEYLDDRTARLDALVDRYRRLIALLRERRAALITHAVTRGLDPSAALKDSGVPWLGEIPAHWEVVRLRWLFRTQNGGTPSTSEPAYWNGDIPFVTPNDLGSNRSPVVDSTQRCVSEEGHRSCGTSMLPPGTLILSTRAPIGYVAIAGIWAVTNQGCRGLVPAPGVSPQYFYYHLVSIRPVLQTAGRGSTFTELSTQQLGDTRVTLPPLSEQRAIAAYLDDQTARIDAIAERAERMIALLQEYRAALITAAVTGRIKVA